jgi:homoserine dehydrogenase
MLMNLALIGFGNVARRFVQLLDELRVALRDEHDVECRVVGIATRRHGCAMDPAGLDGRQALETVARGERLEGLSTREAPRDALDLLRRLAPVAGAAPLVALETTTLNVTDGQPAVDHIRAAFDAGAHVVTANKGPVACAFGQLRAEALARGRQFFFEGAVMDGVPLFNLFRESLPAVRVLGLRGIVNTTTNFIIAGMERGQSFDEALSDMQRAGIAEADASLDVDGWDAAAKTAALMNVLMAADVSPAAIDRTGISRLTPAQVQAARAAGRAIKLVASAWLDEGGPRGRVAPETLEAGDPLARIDGVANAIYLRTDVMGELGIVQCGGDLTQTAYALVTDLVSVRRRL